MQFCSPLGLAKCISGSLFASVLLLWPVQHANAQAGSYQAPAGDADSTTKPKLKASDPAQISLSDIVSGKDSFYRWDSTFQQIQRYNKRVRICQPYTDLGVIGSPAKNLLLQPFVATGFQSGFSAFAGQNKNPDSMVFYKAKVPLTNFHYVQGNNGVFILDAVHTQNFSPGWNLTIDYSSCKTGNLYNNSRQGNKHNGLLAGSNFTNKKGNYSQVLVLSWNRAKRSDNFGLSSETVFRNRMFDPQNSHTFYAPEYYAENTTASSEYRAFHHLLIQKLYTGNQHRFYLFNRTDWKKESYVFDENATTPDTSLYGNTYLFHSGSFHDSTAWTELSNEAGLGNTVKRNDKFPLLWSATWSASTIGYNSIYKLSSNRYFNQGIHGKICWDPYGNYGIQGDARADFFLAGINQGDYNLQGKLKWAGKGLQLQAGLRSQAFTAPLFQRMFTSNYVQYSNTFKKVFSNAVSGGISYRNSFVLLTANLEAGNSQNTVYAGTDSRFHQLGNLSYSNLSGRINLHLKHFYIDAQFCAQTNNQQQLIPQPKLTTLLAMYFEGNLFHKAMYARIGTDVWWQSSYIAYHYNPEMATFYPGTVANGNHPVLDFFVSGEIKTVQVFLKMEHLNARLRNYGFNDIYYSAWGYPMEPIRLRIGLNWRFYN